MSYISVYATTLFALIKNRQIGEKSTNQIGFLFRDFIIVAKAIQTESANKFSLNKFIIHNYKF